MSKAIFAAFGKLTPALAVRMIERWQAKTGLRLKRRASAGVHWHRAAAVLAFLALCASPASAVGRSSSIVAVGTDLFMHHP